MAGFYTMSLDSAVKKKKQANRKLANKAPAAAATNDATVPIRMSERKATQMSSVIEYWSRDPFDRSFAKKETPAQKRRQQNDNEEVVLNGTMRSEGEAVAMVNGEFYKQGDVFGEYELVSIEKTHVMVRKRSNGILMKLEVK